MRNSSWARLAKVFFGLLTLVALLRQLVVHLQLGFNPANFFSYYTILSNLFAGFVLMLSAVLTHASHRYLEILRVTSVINMALVAIVFSALLRDADLGSMLPWVNFVHHYLMPCVVVFDWIIIPPRVRLGARELGISLIFPLAYLVYSLIRGALVGWYPYPFLDARIVGGATGVAIYVIGITGIFAIAGLALVAIGNSATRNHA